MSGEFACHGVGDKCKSCYKHKGVYRRVHIDYSRDEQPYAKGNSS